MSLLVNPLIARSKISNSLFVKHWINLVWEKDYVVSDSAEALEVSFDYLGGSTDTLLDKAVMKKILDIQKLKPEDKNHVLALLDAFLKQTKIQSLMQ